MTQGNQIQTNRRSRRSLAISRIGQPYRFERSKHDGIAVMDEQYGRAAANPVSFECMRPISSGFYYFTVLKANLSFFFVWI